MLTKEILNFSFAGNTIQQYLIALGVVILVLIVLKIFKTIIISKLRHLSGKTKTHLDDLLISVVQDVGWFFYFIVALYIGLKLINVSEFIDKAFYYIVLIVAVFYVVKIAQHLIDYMTKKFITRRKDDDNSLINLLNFFLKISLWVIAFLLVLSNLGYSITPLLAGVGVGGVAIAFALQNVLTDIFASFSIFFDKPFKVGDFIIIGTDMGIVKKIGIKSTRIQTLQGQELIVANKELTEIRINNYKKMQKRRIQFAFGVTYDTPVTKLKKIPAIVKKIIDDIKITKFDRTHFKEFADSSLNFEVVYYIDSNVYNVYMDTQQAINLAIKEQFEKEGIEMAFPTQTIHLNK